MISENLSLRVHSPCPDCGGTMILFCIEPAEPAYEKRKFKCAECRYEDSLKVRTESLRPVPGEAGFSVGPSSTYAAGRKKLGSPPGADAY
jgi:hypothetical protein